MGDVVMKKERYGSILSKLVASNLQCVGGIASNFNCLDADSLDEVTTSAADHWLPSSPCELVYKDIEQCRCVIISIGFSCVVNNIELKLLFVCLFFADERRSQD